MPVPQTSLASRLVPPSLRAAFALDQPPVGPSTVKAVGVAASASSPSASFYRAEAVAIEVALSIPAVRKARHVIIGTPSTFRLAAWQGSSRVPDADPRCAWLSQPDPVRTLAWLVAKTFDDALWHDRCVWRITRDVADRPKYFERIHPSRISTIPEPHDPDTVAAWIIDGDVVTNLRDYLVFDFGGIGGLRRYGFQLLTLYADLQAAAGNYARAPHPKAILKNAGPDLDDDEIDALLADWEAARNVSSVGYLNDTMSYETVGWNPEQMQLVQAREHAALEVARLFALPAKAVDAKSGDSMTYGNIVEYRRDLLEALRPWLAPFTQTLSLDDRSATPRGLLLPRGMRAEFDVDAYLRDDPKTRMETWASGLASGALDLDDVHAAEPLHRQS